MLVSVVAPSLGGGATGEAVESTGVEPSELVPVPVAVVELEETLGELAPPEMAVVPPDEVESEVTVGEETVEVSLTVSAGAVLVVSVEDGVLAPESVVAVVEVVAVVVSVVELGEETVRLSTVTGGGGGGAVVVVVAGLLIVVVVVEPLEGALDVVLEIGSDVVTVTACARLGVLAPVEPAAAVEPAGAVV